MGVSDALDSEHVRPTSTAPLFIMLGGLVFLVIGLVTSLVAYSDAAEIEGLTATERLQVATGPLTLAGVGLLNVAAAVALAASDRKPVRTQPVSPELAALRAQHTPDQP